MVETITFSSYPLFALSAAFLAGILLGRWVPAAPAWYAAAALVAAIWGVIGQKQFSGGWRKRLPLAPGLLLCVLLLGVLRYAVSLPDWGPGDLAYYNDRGETRITGWISAPPDVREDVQYLRVQVDEIQLLEEAGGVVQVRGTAQVQTSTAVSAVMGDRISFIALLKTPSEEEDFSYKDYLSRQGITSVIYRPTNIQNAGTHPFNPVRAALEKLRQRAYRAIFALFPQPEAGLLSGILLGLDNDLPASLLQAYRDTGTAHIIAISGFNTTLIAGLFMMVFSRLFKRFPAFLFSAVAIGLYAVLVGGSPSVVRAAIMSAMAMGGHLLGRKNSGFTALSATAAVMCACNPFLMEDVSFQLSFGATAGLVLFAQPLQEKAEKFLSRWFSEESVRRIVSPLSEYFLITIAAQLITLPIIALNFKRISLSSLLANPLILPVQPAVLYAGGAAALLGTIWLPLGKILMPFTWPLLAYTNRVVTAIASFKGGSVGMDTRLSVGILVVGFVVLFLFLFRKQLEKIPGGKYFTVISFVLITVSVSLWSDVLRMSDGRLHLEWINTQDEVSLVVTAPDGALLAVDPLGSMNELSAAVSQGRSPWRNNLDAVLLTRRTAAASVSALEKRLPVKTVILTSPVSTAVEGEQPIQLDAELDTTSFAVGERIQLDANADAQIAAADSDGAALLLTCGEVRVLIPGGVDPALLRSSPQQPLGGLTALVLTPEDLQKVPADWWQRTGAGVIFWMDSSRAPSNAWVAMEDASVVSMVTDGEKYSITKR